MKVQLFALVAGLATIETANAGVVGEGLYDGHYYEVYNDRKSGLEAFAYAASQTGHCGKQGYLATITSSGENEFIKSILNRQNPWFGLTDMQQEGVFIWENGEVSGYRNWARGEPNDYGGGEDCVHMLSSGKWNDNKCESGRYGFVVEYDCSTAPAPTSSPTVSQAPTAAVTDGGVFGDPHIKTWTGEKYDFHGICDLVMIQNPEFANGLGMDIHVRTKKTKHWSYIAAAVVRIGTETFELVGKGNQYWINGMENGKLESLSDYKVSHKVINSHQEEFTITLDEESKEAIVIKTFKEMVRVNVENPLTANFASSVGLLGSFGSGMKVGRDRSEVIEDNNEFGLEWQVLASEDMLFHNVEGPQAPAKCELPSTASVERRLLESSVTLEDAEIACSRVNAADFDACVFDVLAMDDKDVAGAY